MADAQLATPWRGFRDLPQELRDLIYGHVVTREFKFIITSKRIKGSHIWSGFCSSVCAFGADTLDQYRALLMNRIGRDLRQVHVNVKDFRFGSFTSILKAVESFPEAQRYFIANRAVTNAHIGASPFSMDAPPQTIELRAHSHFAVNLIFSEDFVFDMNQLASFYRTAATYVRRQKGHVHGHVRAMYQIRYTSNETLLKETPAWQQMVRTFDFEDKPAGQAFFIASAMQDFAARPTMEWEWSMELQGLNGLAKTTGVNERWFKNPFHPLWLEEEAELPDVLTPRMYCPICFDDVRVDQCCTLVGCGHKFCNDCIDAWFGRQGKTTCFHCRRDIWQDVEEGDWGAAIDGHVPNPPLRPGDEHYVEYDGQELAGMVNEQDHWHDRIVQYQAGGPGFAQAFVHYDDGSINAGSFIIDNELGDNAVGDNAVGDNAVGDSEMGDSELGDRLWYEDSEDTIEVGGPVEGYDFDGASSGEEDESDETQMDESEG
ncbi:hypothetical protein Tdes44962_MAKER07176 [Teratosphaeria destructans]|uniref:RING-type domain-containing protein n=1 Tax=Teratosphaeria destructans TaxID=418781 RepID=A0A9W7SZU0_9PEZI|nr:hypothetical protein Tdes44962_MAKER07176 [Teratosphaeria destructans]